MQWYLNIDGANHGPYGEAQILQMIQAGQVNNDWIAPEGGEWTSVDSHPPFAQALAARGAAPPPQAPMGGGQQGYAQTPGAESSGMDPDLLKTIPFEDAGHQLAAMQDFAARSPQGGHQAPQAQQGYQAPQVPQAQQGYQAPQAPQAPRAQQGYQAPQAPQAQQGYQAPQAPQAQQGGYQAPQAQQGYQVPQAPQAQQGGYQAPPAQQGGNQAPQAQPAAPSNQLAQDQPPLSQPDPGHEAPSGQPTPPSFAKAIMIAGAILAAIIGVGVLLQILIGPGF
jgi:hypothetical protein